jgi:GPH family glycoside/pentoside/hexuronide:cation symporter
MSDESDNDLSEWELVSTKKMLSYSLGFLISGSVGTGSAIIFYFFEVEIGLPVALLGLALIIFALWNMINDPLAGYLTDRPFKWTRRWGMRYPWILIGVVPTAILMFLLFLSPDADPSNPWPVFWYFLIISCLADTFFSIFTTHLNAGYTTHFRTDIERRRSSAINNLVPAILGLFWGFVGPLVIVYGDKQTFILSAFISLIIRFLLILLLIPGIRESEELKERFLRGFENNEKKKERVSYWKTMKKAFKRRNFTTTFLVFLFLSLAGTLYGASGIYFMKDVLRLPLYFAIFTALGGFLGFIIFIPFWVNRMNKYGAPKVMKISLILIALSYIPLLWINSIEEAVFFSFTGGMARGAYTISLGPVAADVYDECTISDGKHQEAMYEGIRTFFFRSAIIFQAMIFTVVHILTAYNPDPEAIQTPLAVWGIRVHMGLIPALLTLVSFFIMVKWYDLVGEKKLTVKMKLQELGL